MEKMEQRAVKTMDIVITVYQDTGELNVHRLVGLGVTIINVTMWTAPAPVNPPGEDRDVMSVNQDTGELNVNRHVVLDVIIMDVTRQMEAVHVNLDSEDRDARKVCIN